MAIVVILLLALLFIGCVWYVVAVTWAPVARGRLVAFARRQRLTVTAGNGNDVIRYLAMTRRWRATGLFLGLALSIGWSARHGELRVDFLTLFAGWFVGALVAEFRLAGASFGPRRAASLTPRTRRAYLPRGVWALVPAAAVGSVGVAAVTGVAVLRGRSVDPSAWILCGLALVVAAVVTLVQRRVLHRPQPVTTGDVVAADDAIRSRSLYVLAGGGTTLVAYCVLGQLIAVTPDGSGALTRILAVTGFVGVFAVPLFGWLVATSRWPVARTAAGAP